MHKFLFIFLIFFSKTSYSQDFICSLKWNLFYQNINLGISFDKIEKKESTIIITSDYQPSDIVSLFFKNPKVFRKVNFKENFILDSRNEDNKKTSSTWTKKENNYYLNNEFKFNLNNEKIIDSTSFIYLNTIGFLNKTGETNVLVLNVDNFYQAVIKNNVEQTDFISKNNNGFVKYKQINDYKIPYFWSFTNKNKTVQAKLIENDCKNI